MKKSILAVATIAFMSCSAVAGERTKEESRNEFIGIGSGAVIGTAVGGPIGGVVGLLFGALIADDVNDNNRLETAQQALDKREKQLVVLNQQLEKERQQAQAQLVRMETQIEKVMESGEASVQFKTASYEIEDHYKPQLVQLAEGLKNNPRMIVHLSGHADRRGDSTYNQALSEQRAISVKKFLIENGVEAGQLFTQSHGESLPVIQQQSYEADFFDRRVVLRIEEGNGAMTAKH